MDRMKRLQEDDEASPEEMDTRFEKEKSESLLVVTEGIALCVLQGSSFHNSDQSPEFKKKSSKLQKVVLTCWRIVLSQFMHAGKSAFFGLSHFRVF